MPATGLSSGGEGSGPAGGEKAARGVTGKGVFILQSLRIGQRSKKWQRKLKERAEVEGDGSETRAEGRRQLPGSRLAACCPPSPNKWLRCSKKARSPTLANFSPSSLFTTLSWAESTCQQQRASWDYLGGQHQAAPTPPSTLLPPRSQTPPAQGCWGTAQSLAGSPLLGALGSAERF